MAVTGILIPRVPSLHHVPCASATRSNSWFSNPASTCSSAQTGPCQDPPGAPGLMISFSPREAPPGPSPERDAALQGLRCVPDVASRSWQPPECDLFCGLSKVKGQLPGLWVGRQRRWAGAGEASLEEFSMGSARWSPGSFRGWRAAGTGRGRLTKDWRQG